MGFDEIDQLAGQVLMAGFPGTEVPALLYELLSRGALGGVVLFRRNLPDVETAAELNRSIVEASDGLPPLIAVDQEGGRVARLRHPVIELPCMAELGRIDDPALTERVAGLLGAQLATLGFSVNFAPVLDVDTNPENPVIGSRAFGTEPEPVICHAAAFSRGLSAAGVASCGKHFPGHGDTDLDSHLALPRLSHPMGRLESVELRPFRELRDQVDALMTAHVVFDALDPERPATLSPAVVQGLLRDDIGFRGVVFSDDLEMKAISDGWGVAEAACQSLRAGCDMMLICSRLEWLEEARGAIAREARRDGEFERRLRESAQRCRKLRACYPARPAAATDRERLDGLLRLEEARSLEGALASARP